MPIRRWFPVLLTLVVACGGGGGAEQEPDPPSPRPSASVELPFDGSITTAETIRVRGRAELVTAVRVNGVPANTTDGFATWELELPLVDGLNELRVELEEADGTVRTANTIEVQRAPVFTFFSGLAYDVDRNRALIALAGEVYALDLTTGVLTAFSGSTRGAGPEFRNINRMRLRDGVCVVYGGGANSLYTIDLDTGDRTLLSDPNVGDGPRFDNAFDIALDVAGDRVFATPRGRFVVVDLVTGDRTQIVEDEAFDTIYEIVYDPGRDLLFGLDAIGPRIVSIDPDDGSVDEVSGPGVGTGPALANLSALAINVRNGVLWVVDADASALLSVDVASGARTVVSSADVGGGEMFRNARQLEVMEDIGDLLMADSQGGWEVIHRIDRDTGGRTVELRSGRGSGEPLDQPRTMVWDAGNERLVVGVGDDLVSVAPSTGNRGTIVEGDRLNGAMTTTPDGRVFLISDRLKLFELDAADQLVEIELNERTESADDMIASPDGAFLYTIDNGTVREVDIATGTQRVVSDRSGQGAGPVMTQGRGICQVGDQLYVAGNARVFRVDIATGDRVIVSGPEAGTGEDLSPEDIIWDAPRGRLLVATRNSITAVDPATGDRTVISGENVGQGPYPLPFVQIVQVPDQPDLLFGLLGGTVAYVVAIDLRTGDRIVVSK